MRRKTPRIATCQECGSDFEVWTYGVFANKTCGRGDCIRAAMGRSHRARAAARLAARGGMCIAGRHQMTPENSLSTRAERSVKCRACHNENVRNRARAQAVETARLKVEAEAEAARRAAAPMYVTGTLTSVQVDEIVARYEPGSTGPNGTVALAARYGITRADLWEYIRIRKAADAPQPERKRYRNLGLSATMG